VSHAPLSNALPDIRPAPDASRHIAKPRRHKSIPARQFAYFVYYIYRHRRTVGQQPFGVKPRRRFPPTRSPHTESGRADKRGPARARSVLRSEGESLSVPTSGARRAQRADKEPGEAGRCAGFRIKNSAGVPRRLSGRNLGTCSSPSQARPRPGFSSGPRRLWRRRGVRRFRR
jgi:hypothetical protein